MIILVTMQRCYNAVFRYICLSMTILTCWQIFPIMLPTLFTILSSVITFETHNIKSAGRYNFVHLQRLVLKEIQRSLNFTFF